MKSMLTQSHRQELERVEVLSELVRWEGDSATADAGTQFWNRPNTTGPKPHLLGTRIPQSRPMVAGMLLASNGGSITLDDYPLHGGVLRAVRLLVEEPHSYVCISQNVSLGVDVYTVDPDPPQSYLTGQFTATYSFQVIPASEVNQDVAGFTPGTAETPQFSCFLVIGEIWRDERYEPRLSYLRSFDEFSQSIPLAMTSTPLFLPYRGFGYFGGGSSFQQVGLLTS